MSRGTQLMGSFIHTSSVYSSECAALICNLIPSTPSPLTHKHRWTKPLLRPIEVLSFLSTLVGHSLGYGS